MVRKAFFASILVLVIVASYFAGLHHRRGAVESAGLRRILYYVDPMHPAYKSDKPGIAPDCGMQLEPVYADGADANGPGAAAMPAGTVNIDSSRQQLAGVRVAPAE
jgi:Cu(I)/Ag(I) efflux system membrane fusion protein